MLRYYNYCTASRRLKDIHPPRPGGRGGTDTLTVNAEAPMTEHTPLLSCDSYRDPRSTLTVKAATGPPPASVATLTPLPSWGRGGGGREQDQPKTIKAGQA